MVFSINGFDSVNDYFRRRCFGGRGHSRKALDEKRSGYPAASEMGNLPTALAFGAACHHSDWCHRPLENSLFKICHEPGTIVP